MLSSLMIAGKEVLKMAATGRKHFPVMPTACWYCQYSDLCTAKFYLQRIYPTLPLSRYARDCAPNWN